MSQDLSRLLLGDPGAGGRGASVLTGGICTAWDPVTYANTVWVDGATLTNLPVLDPAGMGTGVVLLGVVPSGPIILGRLHRPTT